ncbi:MAG TPA: ATP-binding cassette domain-containing protein [Nocardioidaceae bacterium]|nr:ATP-binding cassette domain-containing protein [Nocardioidaceae bacterium]
MSTPTSAGVAASGVGVRCVNVVQIYRTAGGHDVVALRGVNLDIAPGEQVALLGPSGSGKSTLLGLFGGVLRPSAGRVLLDGQDIARVSERELGRLRAGTVATLLQGAARNLLPYATASDNIDFARRALPEAQRRRLPAPPRLLAMLGLTHLAGQSVGTMSGGEKQRVALAATVSSGAALLLCDEPTSQLGRDDRDGMLDLIHRVGDEMGTTVVLVTHDPEVGARMGRTVTIRNGRIGSEGRHGLDYAVVDADGAVHLPGHLAETFPAGALVEFEETEGGVLVRRVEDEGRIR